MNRSSTHPTTLPPGQPKGEEPRRSELADQQDRRTKLLEPWHETQELDRVAPTVAQRMQEDGAASGVGPFPLRTGEGAAASRRQYPLVPLDELAEISFRLAALQCGLGRDGAELRPIRLE